MKKIKIIIFFSILTQLVFAQDRIVLGINPLRGRSVDFVFRSLSEISNGKSLGTAGIGYTEIYIYLDTIGNPGAVLGWNLFAYANTPTLEPDFGTSDMELSKITLNCAVTSGIAVVQAVSDLTNVAGNLIATGKFGEGDPGGKVDEFGQGLEWKITIAYDCGKDTGTGLLGYNSDFYYTDLIIYIQPY